MRGFKSELCAAEVAAGVAELVGEVVLAMRSVGFGQRFPATRDDPEESSASFEGLCEVGDEVAGMFDANRQPHQVVGHLEWRAGSCCVRHGARMLDQTLDSAE